MFISFYGKFVFIELSHRTPDRMISPEGAILTVKKTYGNSGTPEPAASPVVPYFSNPRISEVIIRKNAELGRNYSPFSVGNKCSIFSDVTKTGSRRGCGLGRGVHRPDFRRIIE